MKDSLHNDQAVQPGPVRLLVFHIGLETPEMDALADRRMGFTVFTRREILQRVTVEAGSDREEGNRADGVKKGV